jgi:hypothetical protein
LVEWLPAAGVVEDVRIAGRRQCAGIGQRLFFFEFSPSTFEMPLFIQGSIGRGIGPNRLHSQQSRVALGIYLVAFASQVNVANIKELIPEFFSENLVRGKGLLARSIITAQQQSPTFTPVYAALLSIINTKVIDNVSADGRDLSSVAMREIRALHCKRELE